MATQHFLILLIVGIIQLAYGQKKDGDTCFIEQTQLTGKCELIQKCPSVVNDIRNRRKHTRCGFQGRYEIVCCPLPSKATTLAPSLQFSKPNFNRTGLRLHEQKCREYQSAVYDYVYATALTADSKRDKIRIDKCGHKLIPLVIGGTLANPREFPHMALVGFDSNNNNNEIHWACGGTLISERYVLTAGHCLYSRQLGEPKFIRLGDLDIGSEADDSRPEDFRIEKIIPHPDWRTSNNYNDIALLKLNRNVILSPYKRPACLPIQFNGPERNHIATGWGKTEWAGKSSAKLQKVILEKFTHTECNETYSFQVNRKLKDGIRDETQICSGSRTESKDTCQGDSGGPLQVYHHSEYCMYTIIGITSFGIACGNIGVPGVYTRIFPYIDWIENIVWK